MTHVDESVSVIEGATEGRTGWAAVRREYPVLKWAVPVWFLALGVLPVLVALVI